MLRGAKVTQPSKPIGYLGCDWRVELNQNSAQMCNAEGCRKHKNLTFTANGMFCAKHLQDFFEVREVIEAAKHIPLPERSAFVLHNELNARLREKKLRGGITDPTHQRIIDDLIEELKGR